MKLTTAIKNCKKCEELSRCRTHVVIGQGPIPCPLVFLGEAPGKNEDETGIPFCGISGQRLEFAAQRWGLTRNKDYHILNTLKCRPPENRDPTQEELDNCRPFLDQQLKVIQPKVIVAFGRFAQAYVLEESFTKVQVLNNMGRVIKRDAYSAVLTCHPAYTRYNEMVFEAFQQHIRTARNLLKRKGTPP